MGEIYRKGTVAVYKDICVAAAGIVVRSFGGFVHDISGLTDEMLAIVGRIDSHSFPCIGDQPVFTAEEKFIIVRRLDESGRVLQCRKKKPYSPLNAV